MDPRPYDGVAIGVVVVSDCRPHRPEDSALSLVPHDERLFSWVTSDRRVFERVPVKGKMGLWTPPQALINIAAAALSAPQASEPQALT